MSICDGVSLLPETSMLNRCSGKLLVISSKTILNPKNMLLRSIKVREYLAPSMNSFKLTMKFYLSGAFLGSGLSLRIKLCMLRGNTFIKATSCLG